MGQAHIIVKELNIISKRKETTRFPDSSNQSNELPQLLTTWLTCFSHHNPTRRYINLTEHFTGLPIGLFQLLHHLYQSPQPPHCQPWFPLSPTAALVSTAGTVPTDCLCPKVTPRPPIDSPSQQFQLLRNMLELQLRAIHHAPINTTSTTFFLQHQQLTSRSAQISVHSNPNNY